MKQSSDKQSLSERIESWLTRIIRFITYDIWRISENDVSGLKIVYIKIIKTLILAIRGFQSENLQTKASALTYSTLLSIVPLLAVLLGIAKGFGFQGAVRQELFDYFPGHELELSKAFEFVESYLAQAQGGVIIGVGLILLLYTVINLISSIEDTFNNIWQIQVSSLVSQGDRLSGPLRDSACIDGGIKRYLYLRLHATGIFPRRISLLHAHHGEGSAYRSLHHHLLGVYRTLPATAQYESAFPQ